MSRQQQRKLQRDANKKVGQLIGLRAENFSARGIKKIQSNNKNIRRLETELMAMGVIKQPSRWEILWGRTKSTWRALWKMKKLRRAYR